MLCLLAQFAECTATGVCTYNCWAHYHYHSITEYILHSCWVRSAYLLGTLCIVAGFVMHCSLLHVSSQGCSIHSYMLSWLYCHCTTKNSEQFSLQGFAKTLVYKSIHHWGGQNVTVTKTNTHRKKIIYMLGVDKVKWCGKGDHIQHKRSKVGYDIHHYNINY